MSKPRLIPARVPWSAAVDVTHIDPVVEGETPLGVVFTAYFTRVLEPGESWDWPETPTVVSERPDAFRPVRDDEEAEYHRVRINFLGGVKLRISEPVLDNEYWEQFDCEEVGFGHITGKYFVSWSKEQDEYFMRTGFRKDPGFFDILESSWIRELGLGEGLKHFLLLGDEMSFEALAQDFTWEKGQATL